MTGTAQALPGILYLVPNTLGDNDAGEVIPAPVLARLLSLRYLVAENPKIARQLLKRAGIATPLRSPTASNLAALLRRRGPKELSASVSVSFPRYVLSPL